MSETGNQQVASFMTGLLLLVFLVWLFLPDFWRPLPSIEITGHAAGNVEFSDWGASGSTIEGKMRYLKCCIKEINYEAFDVDGIKLDTGRLMHPDLKSGEIGKVELLYPSSSKAKKMIISVNGF